MNARRPLTGAANWTRGSPHAALTTPMGDSEVHVWRANIDRPAWPLVQLAQTLSPNEQERADSLLFPQQRRRFIAARGMLRWLLTAYLDAGSDRDPSALRLCYGRHGRPELNTRPGSPAVCFNHSRSQGLALYAVTRGRAVGVDLEALRSVPEAERIAERYFSLRERAALVAVPPEQRVEAFLRGWTGKEAALKATGEGLAGDPRRVEVPITASDPRLLQVARGDLATPTRWSLRRLPHTPGFVATIVMEGGGHRLRCWELDVPAPAAASSTRRPS